MNKIEKGDKIHIHVQQGGGEYYRTTALLSGGPFEVTFIGWRNGGIEYEAVDQDTGELRTRYIPAHRVFAVELVEKG